MVLLYLAAAEGDIEAVKFLVKEAGADVESKDSATILSSGGRAPLSWVAENGHLEVVKFLVKEGGADIEVKDEDGWTPLSCMAFYGHLEVV